MMKQNKIEQQEFGAYLKKRRISKGMSQADLAENLGKPQSFISKVESGERFLTIFELEEIAEEFGQSRIEFLNQYPGAINRTKMKPNQQFVPKTLLL